MRSIISDSSEAEVPGADICSSILLILCIHVQQHTQKEP